MSELPQLQRNVRPSTQANLVLCCSGTSAGPPPDCKPSQPRQPQARAALGQQPGSAAWPPPPPRPSTPRFLLNNVLLRWLLTTTYVRGSFMMILFSAAIVAPLRTSKRRKKNGMRRPEQNFRFAKLFGQQLLLLMTRWLKNDQRDKVQILLF